MDWDEDWDEIEDEEDDSWLDEEDEDFFLALMDAETYAEGELAADVMAGTVLEGWNFGFEVEMIMGDLGLPRYRRCRHDPFDLAPTDYLRALAKLLSKETGEKWIVSDEGYKPGKFCVLPEYNLDPIAFPQGGIAGVELVTPPLRALEAGEFRKILLRAVLQMEGGLQYSRTADELGWHVNVDPGSDDGWFARSFAMNGIFYRNAELPLLVLGGRYGSPYASPQHHAYGPALVKALSHPAVAPRARELDAFLERHAGLSKAYATNLGKLDRGYVELRHTSIRHFLDTRWQIGHLFGDLCIGLGAMPCDNFRHGQRMIESFMIIKEWLAKRADGFEVYVDGEASMCGIRSGYLAFKGDRLGSVFWNGMAEIELDRPRHAMYAPGMRSSMVCGVDADEIIPAVAVLAFDLVWASQWNVMPELGCEAFSSEVHTLGEVLGSAGLLVHPVTSEFQRPLR